MLHIVGGAYFEYCADPHWAEFYGSGGRAAAALQELSGAIILTTYVADTARAALEALAGTFGFAATPRSIPQTLEFHYQHPLAPPVAYSRPDPLALAEPLTVAAPAILRFGLLEGEARVAGERVVYDPQAPLAPRPFGENGSTAAHLAVVANAGEVALLAGGERDPLRAAGVLLADHGAEVVVVKRGSFGALVVTGGGATAVPAYRTGTVWPIGSGDIFSAVFAHHWAEHGIDPVLAAGEASRATAYYCGTRVLPIPVGLGTAHPFAPPPLRLQEREADEGRPLIYLAGPFFTMAERWLINEARAALRDQQLEVFSPLHDIGFGLPGDVAPADLAALARSRAVLAIVDGMDPGTLFEIGYARARDIPVIALAQNAKEGDLTMLRGTDCAIVEDFSTAVYHAAWAALAR